MKNKNISIVFVYNADAGIFSLITDYVHKIISPKTYPCKLCAITFGNTGMKKEWKRFIDNLGIPVEFLHRNEFFERYGIKDVKLPSAFLKKGSEVSKLISSEEISKRKSVKELISLVENKLEDIRGNRK